MAYHRIDPRSWSPVRHREEKTTRVFLALAALAAAAAFFVGFNWQSADMREQRELVRANEPSDPAAREAALAAIDESLRAKHEKRTAGAIAALDRARRTDSSVPGIDVAFAELALKEKQFIEMRAAAGAANKKGDHAAGAAVLFGMDKWLSRGPTDREMSAAADAASTHFAESIELDYYHAPAWFFWGDVLRYAGREGEGKKRALAALRRFNAWHSSDVIAAKIIFASAEAGDTVFGGLTFLGDSPLVQATGDLVNARRAGGGSIEVLRPCTAQLTLGTLAADPGLRSSPAVPDSVSVLPVLP